MPLRVRSVAATIAAILAAIVLAGAGAVRATVVEEAVDLDGVRAVVWFDPFARRPWPTVVFSHGMYMCPTQSRYLMQALAEAGYFVVAPRHSDSNCVWSWPAWSRAGLKPSTMWTESDYRDRADDIRHVVTTLRTARRYREALDVERLALAGHSLGGYTVLGLGGAWPSWKLGGVRAILAMTPYSLPFQKNSGLKNLAAPVMYQIGALDPVFTLPLELDGGGYAQSPAPKYLVEIEGAAHLAWTDLGYAGRDAIVGYAIAFFDRYVKGDAADAVPVLAQKLPGVASFLHEGPAR